ASADVDGYRISSERDNPRQLPVAHGYDYRRADGSAVARSRRESIRGGLRRGDGRAAAQRQGAADTGYGYGGRSLGRPGQHGGLAREDVGRNGCVPDDSRISSAHRPDR